MNSEYKYVIDLCQLENSLMGQPFWDEEKIKDVVAKQSVKDVKKLLQNCRHDTKIGLGESKYIL